MVSRNSRSQREEVTESFFLRRAMNHCQLKCPLRKSFSLVQILCRLHQKAQNLHYPQRLQGKSPPPVAQAWLQHERSTQILSIFSWRNLNASLCVACIPSSHRHGLRSAL